MSTPLRISDLLARSISVEWHEAVALVRAVAECVTLGDGQSQMPELSHVYLSAEGQVSIAGGATAEEPVRRLGQLLQAILGQAEPPVQLRLLVAQATAPSPGFSSIGEYHEALGYFERPDRGSVLGALHERATAAPHASEPQVMTLDRIAPLPAAELPKSGSRGDSTSRYRTRWLTGFAALLLLLGSVAGVRYARAAGVGSGDVTSMGLKASDAMGSAVVTGISALTDRAGLGRLVSAEASSVPPPIAAPSPVRVARTARVRATRPDMNLVPFRAFDLEPAGMLDTSSVPVGPFYETIEVPASSFMDAIDARPEAIADEAGEAIYSKQSEGVSPPVGVRPQLPTEIPSDIPREHLARIELIILPDGAVDSVKLLGPSDVPGAMLLSAAKAWQFQPAIKDGVPVRYRKIVWITSQN